MYVLVYVDDLIMAAENEKMITNASHKLSEIVELNCLGDLKYYLGINIERTEKGIFLIHQHTYIDQVIQKFGMQNAKTSKKRNEIGIPLPDNVIYRSAIGVLLYIATNTRPDIAIATSILSRKISNPTQADWEEVKRVFRYLKHTRNYQLKLGAANQESNQNILTGYADANWAGNANDRKSNSGYLFLLFGGCISWASRKQQCVSLSSTEAEYVALSEACQEGIWISRLLKDFQINSKLVMFEDNQSCLKLLDSENVSNRTKHIDTRYHFAKEMKRNGTTNFKYCPTEHMLADMLTKPLDAVRIHELASKLLA